MVGLCAIYLMNKLAKLRRHASQVHFAKIHFGTCITLHSATNVRVGQYDHCNVNAWLVVKTKPHCQESCWKSFSALSDNGKCDLRLKLNLFYSFSPHIKMDTFGKSAHIRVRKNGTSGVRTNNHSPLLDGFSANFPICVFFPMYFTLWVQKNKDTVF